jgi:hypothetical protein
MIIGYSLTGFSSGYWILQIIFQDSTGLIQNTKTVFRGKNNSSKGNRILDGTGFLKK